MSIAHLPVRAWRNLSLTGIINTLQKLLFSFQEHLVLRIKTHICKRLSIENRAIGLTLLIFSFQVLHPFLCAELPGTNSFSEEFSFCLRWPLLSVKLYWWEGRRRPRAERVLHSVERKEELTRNSKTKLEFERGPALGCCRSAFLETGNFQRKTWWAFEKGQESWMKWSFPGPEPAVSQREPRLGIVGSPRGG